MSSSTLDPDNPPRPPESVPQGHDVRTLGPSDSSDSGSDLVGAGPVEDNMPLDRGTNEDSGTKDYTPGLDDSSDRYGTGARAAADETTQVPDQADIDTDRVVPANEAGLGSGLDEAEEAQLGMTDEELEAAAAGPAPAPARQSRKRGKK